MTDDKKKKVRKSVMISESLHDRLNSCVIANRGDSFATIIEKLLDYYESSDRG